MIGKLFSFLKKNEKVKEESQPSMEKRQESSFLYGVQDTFPLRECNDLVVVGQVQGVVRPGTRVSIINYGDDGKLLFSRALRDSED